MVRLLNIRGVSKKYNHTQVALNTLDLIVEPKTIFGLLGPNGSGKSTTIKLITGILPADEGKIIIDNDSITKNPKETKKKIGYVPDTANMFLHLKGNEYFDFLRHVYDIPKTQCENRIKELSHTFEIVTALDDFIRNYSLGMRKKLLIIGSLLHDPKIWILDEPFNGLDPKAVFDLKTLMRSYCAKGNSVFFSTHLLDLAQQICDKVRILHKGKLIMQGDINEIKNDLQSTGALEKLFLELTDDENTTIN